MDGGIGICRNRNTGFYFHLPCTLGDCFCEPGQQITVTVGIGYSPEQKVLTGNIKHDRVRAGLLDQRRKRKRQVDER
jgi:hypothetical protein